MISSTAPAGQIELEWCSSCLWPMKCLFIRNVQDKNHTRRGEQENVKCRCYESWSIITQFLLWIIADSVLAKTCSLYVRRKWRFWADTCCLTINLLRDAYLNSREEIIIIYNSDGQNKHKQAFYVILFECIIWICLFGNLSYCLM